jgi:hypothetical protein
MQTKNLKTCKIHVHSCSQTEHMWHCCSGLSYTSITIKPSKHQNSCNQYDSAVECLLLASSFVPDLHHWFVYKTLVSSG